MLDAVFRVETQMGLNKQSDIIKHKTLKKS